MLQEERFNAVFMRYMPLIRVIARGYRISSVDIDDIVQDVFVAFYRKYPLDLPEDDNRKLLAEIAKNRCIDYLRRMKTHPEMSWDPVVLQEGMRPDDYYHKDGLAVVIEKQEHAEIAAAMKNMKEEWAEVLCLKIIEGRSFADISEILGISNAACRKRLQRGREYLREYIRQLREEERNWESKRRTGNKADSRMMEPETSKPGVFHGH